MVEKVLTSQNQVSLVIGGAASGKSAFAEALVLRTARDARRIYLASAQAFDAEMRAKIDAHRKQREGDGWVTLEEPLDVTAALNARQAGEIVLFDCATLWLSNQMMADADLQVAVAEMVTALDTCPASVVVVTNEIGQGVVPEHALSRRFREVHGKMNQMLAAQAGLVVNVIAGLPQTLKGQL